MRKWSRPRLENIFHFAFLSTAPPGMMYFNDLDLSPNICKLNVPFVPDPVKQIGLLFIASMRRFN